MSNVYTFETIDNLGHNKYTGVYRDDGIFVFNAWPYFTMIQTNYDGSSYDIAEVKNGGYGTRDSINMMLTLDVKVDLVVKGKETADLILPLSSIDSDYAYFSNNILTLKVNNGGIVTEEATDVK